MQRKQNLRENLTTLLQQEDYDDEDVEAVEEDDEEDEEDDGVADGGEGNLASSKRCRTRRSRSVSIRFIMAARRGEALPGLLAAAWIC